MYQTNRDKNLMWQAQDTYFWDMEDVRKATSCSLQNMGKLLFPEMCLMKHFFGTEMLRKKKVLMFQSLK